MKGASLQSPGVHVGSRRGVRGGVLRHWEPRQASMLLQEAGQ